MYCKHCGKLIADDSKFCQYCGGIQAEDKALQVHTEGTFENEKKKERFLEFLSIRKSFSDKTKKWLCVYIAWILLNLLFVFMKGGYDDANYYFYPFQSQEIYRGDYYIVISNWDLRLYDFSEFLFYVLLLPLLIYFILKYRARNKPNAK